MATSKLTSTPKQQMHNVISICGLAHVYKNIPSSQFLIVRRRCSDLETFKTRSKEIEASLLTRSYNRKSPKQASEKAHVTPSSKTLTHKVKLGHKRPHMVVKHNPCNPPHKQQVAELQRDVTNSNDRLSKGLPDPPLTAERNCKSLKNHLMPTGLPAPLDAVTGIFKCDRLKCLICQQHLVERGNFRSKRTGKVFTIRHRMICDSSNIVYLLYCDTCSHTQYIGGKKKKQS